MRLETIFGAALGSTVGQMRAASVALGAGMPHAYLLVYAADYDVDPWVEMFFYPTDTLKLALLTETGEILWRRDLGRGVVPGMWFCPVLPFDLDGDGVEEIWFVGNTDPEHPLSLRNRVLERLDARTGETTGQWPWPTPNSESSLSHAFRNFLMGGQANGEAVLVTAQGTYGDMYLQGWSPGMTPRWKVHVAKDAPGARGSHMCPVIDLDGDGVDELLWGERCLSLADGAEKFCADRDAYQGHSDIIQPVRTDDDRWFLYTCREGDPKATPRVLLYDAAGRRVWGDVDAGHMDMGWVGRLGPNGEPVATAIQIGLKESGPTGHTHNDQREYAWEALTGQPVTLPFASYRTLPVDLNGDGRHELVRGQYRGDGAVLAPDGTDIGGVNGWIALAGKLLDLPGEQVLAYNPDGMVRLWADRDAVDSAAALARYAQPFYRSALRHMATGSNGILLGGI